MRLGLLASHRGTNVESIVNACASGRLAAIPAVIISNNREAPVLEFARARGIAAEWIGGAAYDDPARRDSAICHQLADHQVDLVLLLGYLRQLGPITLARFRDRILNTHPALLPKHGGHGQYGLHVHESVLAAGDRETGISIHVVDSEYDHGPVIAQCTVPVFDNDTPASLQARVLVREREFLVETLQAIIAGAIVLP